MLYLPNPLLARSLLAHPLLRGRLRAAAEAIASEARERVRVASGETQASIYVDEGVDGPTVHAGGAAQYLEFGAYGRSFPFLRPAADVVIPGGRRKG